MFPMMHPLHLFEHALGRPFDILLRDSSSFRADARELDDEYLVSMSVPGIKAGDLTVSVSSSDGKLSIEGLKHAAKNKHLTLAVDGVFGPATIRALQSFLKQDGQDVGPIDGYFGPATVKALQSFLTLRDYTTGPTDGHFGRQSARAVQSWLADVDVCNSKGFTLGPVDGRFGQRSVVALQLTLNALKVPAEHDVPISNEVALPRDADLDSHAVHATHEDGLLTVRVPKRQAVPVRTLPINAPVPSTAKNDEEPQQHREAPSKRMQVDTDVEVAAENDADWEKVPVPPTAPVPPTPEEVLRTALNEEGLDDEEIVALLLELHGAEKKEACLSDAKRLSKWVDEIDDLAEMGFLNRAACQKALLKADGNLKAAVKALVVAA